MGGFEIEVVGFLVSDRYLNENINRVWEKFFFFLVILINYWLLLFWNFIGLFWLFVRIVCVVGIRFNVCGLFWFVWVCVRIVKGEGWEVVVIFKVVVIFLLVIWMLLRYFRFFSFLSVCICNVFG